jgi:uncharacterized membrane protein YeiH
MTKTQIIYLLDLFGVAVFTISGALAAGRKHMDIFGVIVLGLVTALGGGTLRDILLGNGTVFWIENRFYLLVVFVTAVVTFFAVRILTIPRRGLLISDAVGLAVFTLIGASKTLQLVNSDIIAVLMGMITGVAGGMIRDVLSAEVPLILRKEIYATAALCGGLIYVVLYHLDYPEILCMIFSVSVTLIIRLAAIHWSLSLPVFSAKADTDGKARDDD